MRPKILIISGMTGIGKTIVSQNVSRAVNGEIILFDRFQHQNEWNIISNRPPHSEDVLYHFLSKDKTKNASEFCIGAVNLIKDITSRGKTPIIEGGNSFYTNMLLTGGYGRYSILNESEINRLKANMIKARDIVNSDCDFDLTLQRILDLDNSFSVQSVNPNDKYRLSNRLAEAMTFGQNISKRLLDYEEEIKKKQNLNNFYQVYPYFIYDSRANLYDRLSKRCDSMVRQGIVNEIREYIKANGMPETRENIPIGFTEVIQFARTLAKLNLDQLKRELDSEFTRRRRYIQPFEKMIYKFMESYFTANRALAISQLKWFHKRKDFMKVKQHEHLHQEITESLGVDYSEFLTRLESQDFKYEPHNARYRPKFSLVKDREIQRRLFSDCQALIKIIS